MYTNDNNDNDVDVNVDDEYKLKLYIYLCINNVLIDILKVHWKQNKAKLQQQQQIKQIIESSANLFYQF